MLEVFTFVWEARRPEVHTAVAIQAELNTVREFQGDISELPPHCNLFQICKPRGSIGTQPPRDPLTPLGTTFIDLCGVSGNALIIHLMTPRGACISDGCTPDGCIYSSLHLPPWPLERVSAIRYMLHFSILRSG